ncbi:NUDIX hydrolase [Halobaculum gomorrense]|uniref:8-oxo-dGTP pyrophosphatase MutT, NUDIX family n=1 Tax=Halobaculum gomorrense TaxID=43928 RepID=A0A1M5R144_9EURY|nr:NUDIX domain-containing protein [Halobaculum gomorrense]SHH20157.1 8-oxo-dGTP pyrophosphatase MutT, NUDIX family [Halobaculum gomorrense]
MTQPEMTYVGKACAYITRDDSQLLVFEGPGHDGLQIPKGTIEPEERPRSALYREVREESGLATLASADKLATDVWTRRDSPPKAYVRHFYHASVYEPRDEWTHVVRDGGGEHGSAFEFSWVDVDEARDRDFALALDDYVHRLSGRSNATEVAEAAD